jgi:hypothetical protein
MDPSESQEISEADGIIGLCLGQRVSEDQAPMTGGP